MKQCIYSYLLSCWVRFSSVQSLSRVRLFVTPWTTACQASLSITNSQTLPKLMSVESVMPSNHLILCRPLLLLPSVFPNIRVFLNESALRIRWPKYFILKLNILQGTKRRQWKWVFPCLPIFVGKDSVFHSLSHSSTAKPLISCDLEIHSLTHGLPMVPTMCQPLCWCWGYSGDSDTLRTCERRN